MNRLVILVVVSAIAVNTAYAFSGISGYSVSDTMSFLDDMSRHADLTLQANNAAISGNWKLALSYHNQAIQTKMAGHSAAQKAENYLRSFFFFMEFG